MSEQNPADTFVGQLTGRTFSDLYKRDDSWFLTFSGGITISTESAWRFVDQGRINVTSEDDEHMFGRDSPVNASKTLISHLQDNGIVAAARIIPTSGDLVIDFEAGASLQLLQMSSGYEAWIMTSGDRQLICTGGGVIVAHESISHPPE